jgi:hypothetical protein
MPTLPWFILNSLHLCLVLTLIVVPKLDLQQIGCGCGPCFSQIGPSSCQQWWKDKNGIKALKHKITNKFNKHMNTIATMTTQ